MNGKETQGFFSDVVSGGKAQAPIKKWEPEIRLSTSERKALRAYMRVGGHFDEHIACSIPTFREVGVKTALALANILPDGAKILDIGGSEGTWLKTVASLNPAINGDVLDPNVDMRKAFEAHPVKGVNFVQECFAMGFDNIPVYKPESDYDIVHESMTFQFITPDRVPFIKEVKSQLSEGGLFLTEEKLRCDEEEWNEGEERKDLFKSKYFAPAQLRKKADEVLVGMKSGQAYRNEYISVLQSQFSHVAPYWRAGNFYGYVCSDSRENLLKFMLAFGSELYW